VGGLSAEFAQKIALGFGVGCGPRLDRRNILALRIFAAREANSYIGGLDSGAVGEKEIAKGDGVGDAEGRLAILVVGSDAILQGGQSLLDAFRSEAGRLGSGYGFAGWRGHPLLFPARGTAFAGRPAVTGRLDIALGL